MAARVPTPGANDAGGLRAAARKAEAADLLERAKRGEKVERLAAYDDNALETDLARSLRVESDFVSNVMRDPGARLLDPDALTEDAIARAAEGIPVSSAAPDTATMHPANLVGRYHAWKIKNSYPIPGVAITDDYRRRYLSMYATEQEKVLARDRPRRERLAEVRVTVADRMDEFRLPSEFEVLAGKLDAVMQAQAAAFTANQAADRLHTHEGSPEEQLVFRLMRERKVIEIEQLFARGEINVSTLERGSASTGLVRACSLGLLSVVRLYLKAGAETNYTMRTGLTAMHCAWDAWLKLLHSNPAKKMRYLVSQDIVQLLVEYGADPNRSSAAGITPLHMAAMFGHDNIIAILLRNGADPNLRDKEGRTARDFAARAGHRAAMGLLANWVHVQKAYRDEEFRREWDTVMEDAAARDRARIKGDGVVAVDALVDPRRAARVVLKRERQSYMVDASRPGAELDAEELLKNLRLQQRLREWRRRVKDDAAEMRFRISEDERRRARDARVMERAKMGLPPLPEDIRTKEQLKAEAEFRRPLEAIPVAEYDFELDALREVDQAADHDEAGDHAKATRIRIAETAQGIVKDDIEPRLPWARKMDKAFRASSSGRGGADNDSVGNGSRGGDKGGSDNEEGDDTEDEDGEDGEAEAFVAQSDNLLGDQDLSATSAAGSARNLVAASRLQAKHMGNTTKLYAAAKDYFGDSKSRAHLDGDGDLDADGEPSGDGGESSMRSGSGGGRATNAETWTAGGTGKSKGKGADEGDNTSIAPGSSVEGSARIPGPVADASDVRAWVDAASRKEVAIKYKNDLAAAERLRRKKAERERALATAAKAAAAAATANAASNAAAVDAASAAARAKASAAGAKVEPVDFVAEEALAQVRAAEAQRLKENLAKALGTTVDGVPQHVAEERARESEKERLIRYYRGGDKVAPSSGKDVMERRKGVAAMLVADQAEFLGENTQSYRDRGVHTRRPAGVSAILRPARIRVDTRKLVDADAVLNEGRTFETLMTGASPAESYAALLHASGHDRHETPAGGGGGGSVDDGRSAGVEAASSVLAVSHRGQPTAAYNSGSLLGVRPDGSVTSSYRAQQVAAMGGPTRGNSEARRNEFGVAAQFSEPHLLPANTTLRAAAERAHAEKEGVASELAASGAALRAAQEAAALRAAQKATADGTAAAATAAAARSEKRLLLQDAKKALETEAAQQKLLDEVERVEKLKAATIARGERWVERRQPLAKPAAVLEAEAAAPKPGSFGLGLLSNWPLHRPGPVQPAPGRTIRDAATLDVLESSRAEYDREVQKHAAAYAAYEKARAARVTRRRRADGSDMPDGDDGASAHVKAVGSMMEKASAAARGASEKAAEAAAAAKAVAARLGAQADKGVPELTRAAKESASFAVRKLPRPVMHGIVVGDEQEEEDRRGNRAGRFAVYADIEDPWRQ